MTLTTLVALAKIFRGLSAETVAQFDLVLNSRADQATPNGLRLIRDWLQQIEAESGDDDLLAGDVVGTLDYVRRMLRRMEAK